VRGGAPGSGRAVGRGYGSASHRSRRSVALADNGCSGKMRVVVVLPRQCKTHSVAAMALSLDPYLSEPLQRSLIPAALTVVISLVARALSPRSRIKWGVSHGFSFGVQQDTGIVSFNTLTVFIQNTGRAPAEGVEVHFNYQPEHLQIWPTLNYTTVTNPEGRFTLVVNDLAPKEYFTLSHWSYCLVVNYPMFCAFARKLA
jgi:hypothetical protein